MKKDRIVFAFLFSALIVAKIMALKLPSNTIWSSNTLKWAKEERKNEKILKCLVLRLLCMPSSLL